MDTNKIKAKLQQSLEENPVQTLAVGALVMTAISKFMTAYSNLRRDRTWDREVARRERKTR